MTRVFMGSPILLMGLVLLLMPQVMRRGTYFGVAVADDFRATAEGRRAAGIYRGWVGLALAVAFVLWCVWPTALTTALFPVALFLVGAMAFYKAHGVIVPFTIKSSPRERSVAISAAPDRLPTWTWWSAGPFVLLTAAALFLTTHWNSIPARFPVHTGLDGTADRWAERSMMGVYGPLVVGVEICVFLSGMGLASWYGARRSALRARVLGMLILTEYWLAVLFCAIAVQPILGFPGWVILIPILCVPFSVVAYAIRTAGEPGEPRDSAPEDCWKYGVFYYNPNDAALFVERRTGFGYTINFGNRWSWAFLAGLILVIGTIQVELV